MLRNKPRLKYSGITVILQNPGRFDTVNLLSSTSGVLFNNLLQPEYNTMQVDIRLMEDRTPFIEGTKAIMLLGEHSMWAWCPETLGNNLNEMRGSPLYVNNIPAIASYFPQDCTDMKAWEQQHNELSKEYTGEEESSDDNEEGDVKRFSPTKRSNYAFWLKSDLDKVKRLLKQPVNKWEVEAEPVYKLYPPSDEVVSVLSNTKNCYLDFDIETDYEEQNLLCFSFTFDGRTIYSVPVVDHNYKWAYSMLPSIIRSLTIAIRDNILVAHNGAAFDFFVLGSKYRIPIYRVYDTMIATHRCFPDIEKSLGHCVSKWTNQRFHKDSAAHGYSTREKMMEELKYCGKDVFTMRLVRESIQKYAPTVPGLVESIECGQRSIRPYLVTMLQGIRYDPEKVEILCKENDALMEQYLRIINMLIGPIGLDICKKSIKGKAKGFPGSNTQCCNYFHDQLGYQVISRSTKTQKPSLGKKNMFKLALRYNNPVILFTLLYRQVAKEYSALRFHPWKDDNNKIIPYVEEE